MSRAVIRPGRFTKFDIRGLEGRYREHRLLGRYGWSLEMQTHPELYPPRLRSTNVTLIRGVLQAGDQTEFEAADAMIARSLHPSLFSELDWMERTIPPAQRERGGALADDLFIRHLPALVAQRLVEFALGDAALSAEVDTHRDFYEYATEQRPDVAEALGPELAERIRRYLAEPPPTAEQLAALWYDSARSRLEKLLRTVEDRDWLWFLIYAEVQNAMVLALDHLSSRIATKALVRASGGDFPQLPARDVRTRQDAGRMAASLREAADQATGYSLLHMAGTCRAIADVIELTDPSSLVTFSGDRAAGGGPCGTCSMRYCSSAIVSLDPTCPGIFDDERDMVYVGLNLNVDTCLFCGTQSRADSPALFYTPRHNLVIYNAPRLGQFTESEAREVHRDVLAEIRQRYMERVGEEKAITFEHANEEFTDSITDFLIAIQMGTTAKEEHVYGLIRSFDGGGFVVDPTKRVMISLTPQEVADQSIAAYSGQASAPRGEGSDGGPTLDTALEAFNSKDYDRARQILEALHAAYPRDDTVRKNLAVVYVTLDDKQAARDLLRPIRR